MDLASDELLRLALTKLVEIVGEAAKHVSPELRAASPEVPWTAAVRTRDRLIHHYFDINLDVLWQTVTSDLPRLRRCPPATANEHPRSVQAMPERSRSRLGFVCAAQPMPLA
jgi:uncharacterized protein with HEPN domain